MGTIDAYLPMDRRQELARGEQLPDRTMGAVLFADISGFTRFSSMLNKQLSAPLSVEVLTEHLDRVYSALISEVHRYGGSVIGFGGDSLTCWFDQDPGRQATAAALDMQKVFAQLESLTTPSGSQYPIGIKIAVTSGNARRFLVGLPRIQRIEVLAGSILDRMAAAENQLESGEVIVGSEVMGRLGNLAIVREWRRDRFDEYFAVVEALTDTVPTQPWPPIPDLDPEVASDWLFPAVYQRLLRGEGEFLAELRPAVAAFIKFRSIDYDHDDDAGQKLDAYVRWVQRVLERYEGLLLNLIIGDKGSYMYCAFGARISHENDVDRALAASSELTTPPEEMGYIKDIQIGITRGQMRVGSYGAPSRRTYGAYGFEVNLASRLMGLAKPGQILTSSRIVKEASRNAVFTDLGPIKIKGIDEPFPVYALKRLEFETRTTIVEPSLFPIIGREPEKEILADAMQALQGGNSSAVVINGEAGIGKTRLVEYLLRYANRSQIYTMVGTGDEIGKSSLYYAWRPIIRKLLALEHVPESIDRQDKDTWNAYVLGRFEEFAPNTVHLAPLFNELLQCDLPENELTSQMEGEVRADNITLVLIELLSRVVRSRQVLLILEDVHWFDSASWSILRTVTHDVHPLMLVITHRPMPEPFPAEYTEILDSPNTRAVSLDIFSSEEVERLICQRLEITELPKPVLDLIYQKAEGNPFFSEELMYALQERNLIKIDRDDCQLSTSVEDLVGLDFPDTSRDVIRSRIDRLTPQEQLTIKVASVIGRNFSHRLLHDIHPIDSDKVHLESNLETLAQNAFIRKVASEPELEFSFKHNIIHEVAYNLMLSNQRRELHRSIASWYERNYAADLAQVYPLLAHHWNQTENTDKAIEFLYQAGKQALRNFANREAVTFLTGALFRADSQEVVYG